MSSFRQVRRLLQQTADWATDRDHGEKSNGSSSAAVKRKKAKQAQQQQKTPVDEQKVIRHQVDSLLQLDRRMTSNDSKKKLTACRIREKHSKQRHIEKSTAKKILGNTRSSSTTLNKAPIPTFNKRRYKKQQEEKRLAHIAKLLKKNSATSKMSKSKLTPQK